MKIVKAELDDVMHADFKSWCAKRGTTMGKQIGWWIMNGLGEVGKVPEVKAYKAIVADTVEPSEEPVQDIYSIETGKCGVCGESFPVKLLQEVRVPGTTRKKKLCAGCIENARNGQ